MSDEQTPDRSLFGEAWRAYIAATDFERLSPHDRALIRVAFVAGWRARMAADGR